LETFLEILSSVQVPSASMPLVWMVGKAMTAGRET
jgi:hypothetical protein